MRNLEEEENVPDEINDWYSFEEEARDHQIKIWQYGDAGEDSDYE